MVPELFRRGIRDHRRALAAWCAGVSLYALMIAAVFPSVRDAGLQDIVKKYPEALKSLFGISGGASLSTGPGYLDVELFSLMLPLFALVLAIGSGARTLAGEEEAGRLELPMSYPLRRRDAVLEKGAAVAAELVVFCTAVFVALLLWGQVFGLDLAAGHLAAAMSGIFVLAALHGWLALAVGAAAPSRALAVGVPAGVAAVGYLIAGLHSLAGWLDPFRYVSSFWWIGQSPLEKGLDLSHVAVPACAAAIALAAAALLIERRDLRTP
jgi:ABC-2 type transport system permease protein